MPNRLRSALTPALLVLAVAAPGAAAAPVSVNLRVEGATQTIFDGPVTTDGHAITTPSSGGPQVCDGTNGGRAPHTARWPTAVLDDRRSDLRFGWDATWDASFKRFSRQPGRGRERDLNPVLGLPCELQPSRRWAAVSRRYPLDDVLWVFDAFSKTGALSSRAVLGDHRRAGDRR